VIDDRVNCKANVSRSNSERVDMLRHHVGLILLLAITCGGLSGCASGFGFNRTKFAKGEQWETDIEEEAAAPSKDWRNSASTLRSPSNRKSNEDPIDKLLWSDESRDINRSLGGSL
jgi:hypothetical protein